MHIYFSYDFVPYRVSTENNSVDSNQGGVWAESNTESNVRISRNAIRIRDHINGAVLIHWNGGNDSPVALGTPIVRVLRNGEVALSRAGDAASRVWVHANSRDDLVQYQEIEDLGDEALRYALPYGIEAR